MWAVVDEVGDISIRKVYVSYAFKKSAHITLNSVTAPYVIVPETTAVIYGSVTRKHMFVVSTGGLTK